MYAVRFVVCTFLTLSVACATAPITPAISPLPVVALAPPPVPATEMAELPPLPPPEGNVVLRFEGFAVYRNRLQWAHETIVTPTGEQLPVECGGSEVNCGPVAFTRHNGVVYQVARHGVLRYNDQQRVFEPVVTFDRAVALSNVATPTSDAFLAKTPDKKKTVFSFVIFENGTWRHVRQKSPRAYAGEVYMIRRSKPEKFALYFIDNHKVEMEVDPTTSIVAANR